MNCELYQKLSHKERVEMVGKIVHAMQSDDSLFCHVSDLIKIAERKGLFEDVVINPIGDNTREPKINDIP